MVSISFLISIFFFVFFFFVNCPLFFATSSFCVSWHIREHETSWPLRFKVTQIQHHCNHDHDPNFYFCLFFTNLRHSQPRFRWWLLSSNFFRPRGWKRSFLYKSLPLLTLIFLHLDFFFFSYLFFFTTVPARFGGWYLCGLDTDQRRCCCFVFRFSPLGKKFSVFHSCTCSLRWTAHKSTRLC